MKKLALSIVLGIFLFSADYLSGKTPVGGGDKVSAVQISIVTPLGTNGIRSSEYTNFVSLNLLAGVSKNERVFTFGGLANIIGNEAGGLQFAGLGNYVGNSENGVQIAGLANISGDLSGLQFGGLANITTKVSGAQVAGLGNIATEVSGFQVAGLGNIAAEVSGFQVSGFGNIATRVSGAQVAGLGNIATRVSGAQVAGLGNIATRVSGAQVAGLVNIATRVSGAQVAGLVNIATRVSGVQVAGLVNIATRVSGVQVAGLVNIADKSDYPIGLLNIISEGEMGIAASYNEIGTSGITFRSGGKVTYGILGVGYNFKTDGNAISTLGGFGAHINLASWLRLNNELTCETLGTFSNETTYKAGYALMPAFRLAHHFEFFGGPSLNYLQTSDIGNKDIFPGNSLWKKFGSSKLKQLYVGYQFGIQYIF